MPETALAPHSDSKLGRRLQWFVVGIATVFLWHAALEEDLAWIGWATVAVLVVLLTVTRWPYGALVVLIGASTVPRFFVELFGWKARPEHFAVAIVSSAVFVWLLRSNQKFQLEKVDYWVLAYVAANYVSSAFGSSSPADTLRWALLNNLAVLPYFLVRLLVRDAQTFRKAFGILLAAGIAESAYGILCYLSHYALGTTAGMGIGQYMTDVAAPYGSLAEANLFGAYAGCSAVLALTVYLVGGRRARYLICFFVGALATVLSLSRAALLALVIAVGWVLWQSRNARERHRSRTATLVVAVALILLIITPTVGGVVQQRFRDLFSQGLMEQTTVARLIEAQEALQEFSEHRLIGTGTSSLQLSFDWGKYLPEMHGDATWVGNIIVRILHDTGVLGLVIALGFVVSLGWKIRSGLRGTAGQAPILVALTAGALLYAISFQATDATLGTFPWVHLGLLSSAALLSERFDETTNRIGSTIQRPI